MIGRKRIVSLWLSVTLSGVGWARADGLVEGYLNRYFETFPTAATAAGRHELDHQLENLGSTALREWLVYNRRTVDQARGALVAPDLDREDRLDLELLLRQAESEVFRLEVLDEPSRNPLYWTAILSNATVFLLVREDLPASERLTSAAARAEQIPRLVSQALDALDQSEPRDLSAELCAVAEQQTRSTALFYEQGFPRAGENLGSPLRSRLESVGSMAASALSELAQRLADLKSKASGSARLEGRYQDWFRLRTGVDRPVGEVLADARRALEAKVRETADYGRRCWDEIFPRRQPPAADRDLIRTLFDKIGEDRARTNEEFVSDYRELIARSVAFVRDRQLMTLPEPLTLRLGESPAYFVGQSVGGVYPAGPWAPEDAETLLFLPMPPAQASDAEREAFFRDFNHHFNVMITPHETVPGHYLQLKLAARHPRKIRAIFGDGVYIEGWGTFAERLMLDLGWGGPLDRLAHLKKQLENIARTIVDIRVHTQEMSRQEVLDFVQEDAFQNLQFAQNMWRRAISSAPQLTYYFLGYREVWALFEEVRETRGEEFELKTFMDGMMELGPVPVRHYRVRMLGDEEEP